MRQTIKDGKSELIPSKFLCIKFSGQMLPKYVSLFHTRHAVSTFIPKVRICYNCFRAGHISKSCRSNARCVRYGEPPHANSQECSMQDVPPRCINCNGSHLPPLLTTAHWSENISLLAARKRISTEHPTSERDYRFDYTNFSSLNHGANPTSQLIDTRYNRYAVLNSDLANNTICNDHSYASVASTNLRRTSQPTGKNTRTSEFFNTSTRNFPRASSESSQPKLPRDPREDILLYRNGRTPLSLANNGIALIPP
ncbi:hypothetical protein ALC57_05878 [Trachymyrmex cornetzi]|uniref:CCHC-type domain-containing protein n=1 Tax=Trachymyrmex cornetzi TaxID=471704 RepID=A0A151J9N1_9HYME|nr:hypothetical protein ALC57_05878 [Trachymyrmex cornetzi]